MPAIGRKLALQQPPATSNNLVGADNTGVEDTVVVDETGVADAGVDNADVGIDNGAGDFTGDAGAMDGGIQ